MSAKKLVGLSDAARMLGVSVFTIRRLVARGDIGAVNVGARRLVAEGEIERIMQRGAGQSRPSKATQKGR